MNEPSQLSEQSLFIEALEQEPAARGPFLDQACADQPDLRKRIDKLLLAHENASLFLQPPDKLNPTVAFKAADHAGTQIGPYQLIEEIGVGGMGSVWMAQQSQPVKRMVAIKLIKSGMDSKLVLARFAAERQALALMDHPNIAKVLDAGATPDGRPYFVLELVKGVPITKFCDERRLTPRERLELFIPVCQAIQHAHQKGIIHRDIKPSNVLVALYDDHPVPKVIDFGVAKATGQQLTEHTLQTGFGAVVGTPQYMSPEQATFNNLDIDTRSDVYSLGVLLYELLTGSPPFSAQELEKAGLLEVLRVVREQEPPRPSTKVSTAAGLASLAACRKTEPRMLTGLLRHELDWIVMKALEKDRSRRYDTANGFAADVQRYLTGEPILAHPPSTAYRVQKFLQKNKGKTVAAMLLLLALMAGLAGTSWGLIEAKIARDDTATALDRVTEEQKNTKTALDRVTTEELKAREAEQANRRVVARQYVAKGTELLEQANRTDALAWFVAALAADAPDSDREEAHRTRIGMTARMSPRPDRLWFDGQGEVLQAGFVPGGGAVYSVAREKTELVIRIWDQADGKLRFPAIRMPSTWTYLLRPKKIHIGFSGDGKRFWTMNSARVGARTVQARVWNSENGTPLTAPFTHLDITFEQMSSERGSLPLLSPDGKLFVTLQPQSESKDHPADDQKVRRFQLTVWDVDRNALAYEPLTLKGGMLNYFCTADFRRIVATTRFGDSEEAILDRAKEGFRIWDLADGKPVTDELPGCAFMHSRDGRFFLTIQFLNEENRAAKLSHSQIWDVSTAQPLGLPQRFGMGTDLVQTPYEQHVANCFGLNGKRFIGRELYRKRGSDRAYIGSPKLFDGISLQAIKSEAISASNSLAGFSPNGERLIAARNNDAAEILDADKGQTVGTAIAIRGGLVNHEFTTDSQRVLLVDGEHRAHVAGTAAGTHFARDLHLTSEQAPTAGFGAGGGLIFMFAGTEARVWNAATGNPSTPLLIHTTAIRAAELSHDGFHLLTACEDGTVRTWPVNTGEPAAVHLAHGSGAAVQRFMNLTPDGNKLLTETALGQSTGVGSTPLAFRPSQLTYWSEGRPQVLEENWRTDGFHGPFFSPDKTRFAALNTGEEEVVCRIFDSATGRPIGAPMNCPLADSAAAFFSPDGKMLVTNSLALKNKSWETTLRIWDVSTGRPQSPPLVFQTPSGTPQTVFIRNGEVLVAWDSQGIRAWDAKTGTPLNDFFAPGPLPPAEEKTGTQRAQTRDGKLVTLSVNMPEADLPPQDLPPGEIAWDPRAKTLWSHEIEGNRHFARTRDPQTGKPLGPQWELPSEALLWPTRNYSKREGGESKYIHLINQADGKPTGAVIKHNIDSFGPVYSDNRQRISSNLQLISAGGQHQWKRHRGLIQQEFFRGEVWVWDAQTGEPLAPPFSQLTESKQDYGFWRMFAGRITPDGRHVITRPALAKVRLIELAPDPRSLDDLARLVAGLAGKKLSESGTLVPLEREKYQAAWTSLATLLPPHNDPEYQQHNWHRQQFEEARLSQDLTTAIFHCDRLLELNPSDTETLRERGNLAIQLDDLAGADQFLASAVKAKPADLWAWMLRGKIELKRGNYRLAGDHFQRAAELSAAEPNYLLVQDAWRYYLFSRALAGDQPAYRRACDELLAKRGNQEMPFLLLRWTTMAKGGNDNPLQLLQRVLDNQHKYFPEQIRYYPSIFAQAYLRAGDPAKALAALQEFEQQNPEMFFGNDRLLRAIALCQQSKFAEARQEIERARQWGQGYVYGNNINRETGDSVDYSIKLLYVILLPEAEALLKQDEFSPEAIARARETVAAAEKLVVEENSPSNRATLAARREEVGELLRKASNRAFAHLEFEQALEIRKQLAVELSDEPDYVIGFGWAYNHFGDRARNDEQLDKALEWYGKTIEILGPATENYPERDDAKNGLRHAHWERGHTLTKLKRHAEAVTEFNRAGALSAKSSGDWFNALSYRALSRVRAGQIELALRDTEAMLKVEGSLAAYNSACIYALAAAQKDPPQPAEKLADRALELLREAVKRGYANPREMAGDDDLDAVRARPEFRTILDVAGKKNDEEYRGALTILGRKLLDSGRAEAAEATMRECLRLRELVEPDAWYTAESRVLLAQALLARKDYAAAEPLLLAAHAALKKQTDSLPPAGKAQLAAAVTALIQLYETTEKPEDVAKWKQE